MAQQLCGPRADLLSEFKRLHNEAPALAMNTDHNSVVELLLNTEADTWSLIETNSFSITCVLSTGKGPIHIIPYKQPERPA